MGLQTTDEIHQLKTKRSLSLSKNIENRPEIIFIEESSSKENLGNINMHVENRKRSRGEFLLSEVDDLEDITPSNIIKSL